MIKRVFIRNTFLEKVATKMINFDTKCKESCLIAGGPGLIIADKRIGCIFTRFKILAWHCKKKYQFGLTLKI